MVSDLKNALNTNTSPYFFIKSVLFIIDIFVINIVMKLYIVYHINNILSRGFIQQLSERSEINC